MKGVRLVISNAGTFVDAVVSVQVHNGKLFSQFCLGFVDRDCAVLIPHSETPGQDFLG